MKPIYCITLTWPSGKKIEAPRADKNDAQARKRLQICADICGKDENGARFSSATIHRDGTLIYTH